MIRMGLIPRSEVSYGESSTEKNNERNDSANSESSHMSPNASKQLPKSTLSFLFLSVILFCFPQFFVSSDLHYF